MGVGGGGAGEGERGRTGGFTNPWVFNRRRNQEDYIKPESRHDFGLHTLW